MTLGRYFTFTVMTSADQPVVTSGPYRFVRHPGYTGVLLIVIGAGLVNSNWIGLGGWTLLILLPLLYRIRTLRVPNHGSGKPYLLAQFLWRTMQGRKGIVRNFDSDRSHWPIPGPRIRLPGDLANDLIPSPRSVTIQSTRSRNFGQVDAFPGIVGPHACKNR